MLIRCEDISPKWVPSDIKYFNLTDIIYIKDNSNNNGHITIIKFNGERAIRFGGTPDEIVEAITASIEKNKINQYIKKL